MRKRCGFSPTDSSDEGLIVQSSSSSFAGRPSWVRASWAAVGLAVLAALAGVFAHLRLAQREETVNLWVARIEAVADARARAVKSWLAERYADAQLLAWNSTLIGVCAEGACPRGVDPAEIAAELDSVLRFGGVLGAYLFAPDGQLLLMAESGAPPRAGAGAMARKVARERRSCLHDVHWIDSQTALIGFLAPVFGRTDGAPLPPDAPVIGVVGLYLDPRPTLFPIVQGSGAGLGGPEIYLVRREGDEPRVFVPPPGRSAAAVSAEVTAAAVDRSETVGTFSGPQGRPVLAAVRWLPAAGWGLVVQVSMADVLAEWRRETLWETGFAVVGVLCLALGGVAAWRSWSSRRYRLLLEGLRDREERLRALAEGTEDLVFVKDAGGAYQLVNPATARLLGIPPGEAVGRRTSDLLPGPVSRPLEDHDRQVLRTGRPYHGEEQIPVDGRMRTFLSSRIPLRDEAGRVRGVAGVLRDITDRKAREAELARRAQTLEGLYRLGERLALAETPDEVLEAVLGGASAAFGADVAAVLREDPATGGLVLAAHRGLPGAGRDGRVGPVQREGVVARVCASSAVQVVTDAGADPGSDAVVGLLGPVASVVVAPVRTRAGTTGVLVLGFSERRAFGRDERDAVAVVGHMAGVALERARAMTSLEAEVASRQQAEARLRRFYEASAGFTGPALFARLARALASELGSRWVMINRLEGDDWIVPLAAVEDGAPWSVDPYPLRDTPCADVVGSAGLVYYRQGVRDRFPDNRGLQNMGVEGYAGFPLKDSRGAVIGALCVLHDQPLPVPPHARELLELYARQAAGEVERLRSERRLAETRRALDTLIDNLPGAVYRCADRPERPLAFISPGCREVAGYDAAALLSNGGTELVDWVVPEDRARVWREIRTAAAARRAFEVEYRIHDADGRMRWIYDVGRVVPGPNRSSWIEGILFDHTDRRSLEAQLTHSQRMESLGRLAGGVAHDFNNLLTAITGYAELLLHRLPEGEERSRRAVGEIVRAADRAADLTRQLLAFSRRQVVEPRVVDLNVGLADVLGMLDRLLGEDVRVELELSEEPLPVRVDPAQVEQVIMNLAVNARDAMPGGGTLTIRTATTDTPHGPFAQLEVRDTGTGIPEEVLDHVFEPFFTTKEEGRGTGLGLATVYGIVTQAGGTVTVSSEPGRGTVFRVLLPRVDPDRATAGRGRSGGDVPQAAGWGRVAVVEDDPVVRGLAAEHLREEGYEVVAFSSAEDAEAALAGAAPVDLLLTDVVLPGIRGPELAARLRRRWPGLQVVFVTGHADSAGLAGATVVPKPFRLEVLAAVVGEALAPGGRH